MTPPRPVEITPHMAIGVSLALLGVVLTLDNLGFVEFGEVMRFWPLIPMLVGTALHRPGARRSASGGSGWRGCSSARPSCCAISTSSTST